MSQTNLLLVALMTPFVSAVLSPLAYRYLGRKWGVVCPLLGALIPVFSLLPLRHQILSASLPMPVVFQWVDAINLSLHFMIDGFGVLFALLVAGMGTLIVWYAHFYMKHEEGVGRFFGFLLFFLGSMLGICLAEHMFTLFLFWELTSFSSFLLIGFWHHKEKSRNGALKALVITAGGGLIMMAGFALLGTKTGFWTWTQLSAVGPSLMDQSWMTVALILILIGAFTKSAQFPFHIWLPDAMEAPTPVSAFLHSATMVKAGIILIFKIYPIFSQHPLWFPLLTLVGMTTVVVGAVLALKHTDLKAILAYSTISQLGLFVVMLGYASVETIIRTGLIFHIFIHAFYKGGLFMLAGIIDHSAHSRDIRKLGLLKKTMPKVCVFMILAAASLAGLPPFLGFISKEGAIESSLHMARTFHGWTYGLPVVYVISALLTVAVALKISLGIFFSAAKETEPKEKHPPQDANWGFLLPPALLASAGLLFGLFPNFLEHFLFPSGLVGLVLHGIPHFSLWHGFSFPLLLSGLAITGGVVLFLYRDPVQAVHEKMKLGWNLNTAYEKKWEIHLRWAERFTQFFQSGSLTQYVGVTLGFIFLLLGITFWTKVNWSALNFLEGNGVHHEALVSVGIGLFSLMVVLLKDRIARLVSLGGVGLLICIYFILRGAPDLALTGFLVEIVMFVLILIIFNQLKDEPVYPSSKKAKTTKFLIASAGGLTMGTLVFLVLGFPLAPSISDFFLKNSEKLAGGLNAVNVIVVDFRGFDTLGEITVLTLAGLGVLALRKVWVSRHEVPASPKELGMKPLPTSQILEAVSFIAVPLTILFSFYMVYRGHNQPGGGFIGGLITGGALILELLVVGRNRFLKTFPVQGKFLFVGGLTLAFITGLGPLLFGFPFLTSYVFESIHFSTAGIFDLGVYFTVVGVTMEIIVLVEDSERTPLPSTEKSS